uniref:Uncharacterized protein n=1 Tax=Mus spicilegus TaxID=10103 RepID=A0A8C6HNU3_MUSSI
MIPFSSTSEALRLGHHVGLGLQKAIAGSALSFELRRHNSSCNCDYYRPFCSASVPTRLDTSKWQDYICVATTTLQQGLLSPYSTIDVLASWFVVIATVDCSVLLRQLRIPPDMTQTSPSDKIT